MKAKWILLSAALLAGSLTSCGSGKTKIGILQFGSFEALEKAKQGFVDAMNESTLKDQVEITVKNAAANGADNTAMAATLASSSDLVYGVATPSASALKNAVDSIGSNIPVLFSAVTNCVGANLLKNEAAPEGNCTGVVDLGPIDEELDILTKFPGIKKVVSFYTQTEVNSVYQAELAEKWMDAHSIAHERKTITNASEISSAFAAIGSDVDAVFLPTDDTIANAMNTIKSANEARTDKLVIVGSDTGMIEGSTFAMGVDYYECGVQAGKMAISVLNKSKTIKELPVERCDTSAIVVNKTWSESIGIAIPQEVLDIKGVVVK